MILSIVWCPLSERVGTVETQYSIYNALISFSSSTPIITARYQSHSTHCIDNSCLALVSNKQLEFSWRLSRVLAGRLSVLLISVFAIARLIVIIARLRPSQVVFYTCIFPTPILLYKWIANLPFLRHLLAPVKLANFIQGTPSFCNPHITDYPRRIESKLRSFIYSSLYRYSDIIITSTPSLKTQLAHIVDLKMLEDRHRDRNCAIQVIPNAVISSAISYSSDLDLLSESPSVYPQRYDFCFIGRLTYQKNILNLIGSFLSAIEACAISSASTLTIVGSGDLESLILSSYGCAKQLNFLGYRDRPWDFVLPSSIVVVPSLWEEPGHVPIEALARGYRTLISTGCTFVDFIPECYRSILSFDPSQINSLFLSLERRADPAIWREILINMKSCVAKFTSSSFQQSMKHLILELE